MTVKALFALLGQAIYSAASAPDSRDTMPSGHSEYVGVLATARWPVSGQYGRIGLRLFAGVVGLLRIGPGARFPVVIAGSAPGCACVAIAGPRARPLARGLPLAGATR
ncbi:hypothetical protein A8M77_27050 [Variovorax sp. JS1663]|nr:hypothetical protein A8M77_27050 [Variovorax sp. JS1663]